MAAKINLLDHVSLLFLPPMSDKLNFRDEGPGKRTNVLGPIVILGVHLVCLGTENCQKPSNAFFFGPELIYVGKSIQHKIIQGVP